MQELWQALVQAVNLIVSLDPEVIEISLRSLYISAAAILIAAVFCIPIGGLIHFHDFRGKRVAINVIQTFYSLPTVVVGLFVYLFISRSGPLGGLELLFTPAAIIIGQVILIMPVLTGMTIGALSGVDKAIRDTALSSGASATQAMRAILFEAKFAVVGALILGFGRAISEVGAALMLGGNIRGYTRVLTTAISLETQRGDLVLSLALGIILIGIAMVVSVIMNILLQRY
ncbi:MAG: ABC transporter permease subunit [Dehalococcoidia bacterium]|nr:MAG: ABC transporter permease subunit [Dehalococcoidia bacterium]